MGRHSKLGPSSADRWFACAGSIQLISRLPASAFKPNEYAAEGTVAHTISYDLITGKADFLELTGRVGEVVMQDGFEITISDEMLDGAIEYQQAIDDRRKELTKPIAIEEFAEEEVKATSAHDDVWGTADKVMFQRGHKLFIFDYKFGKGVVDVTENKQMLTYAVAVIDTLCEGVPFDEIILVIVQPRAAHKGETVREYRLSKRELDTFRLELKARAIATTYANAPREAGAWCRFCPALPHCPEAKGKAQQSVLAKFDEPFLIEGKDAITQAAEAKANEISLADLSRVLDYEDFVDAFTKACRERAQRELIADANSVPGYKLVEGRSFRQWENEQAVKDHFEPLLGDKIYKPLKLHSPAQMEKIAGKKEVEAFTIKPEGKLTVAKTSDKREAKAPTAQVAAMLEVVQEEDPFGLTAPAEKDPIWPV